MRNDEPVVLDMDKPEVVRILKMRDEAVGIKTITLDKKIDAHPGQFVMLWIPGVGEKPFSLSRIKGDIEITFDVKGAFTKKFAEMNEGDLVGVRGPYGNGWDPGCDAKAGAKAKAGCNIAIVAGGLGLAPLMPVIECKCGSRATVIYGAKSADFVIFKKRLEASRAKVIYTTDDGSFGEHCYACDALGGVIKNGGFGLVLTCGPEVMMKKVADICLKAKIPCQVSMERHMKCGVGICGSCAIDPSGLCVCKDGPVFTAKQLKDSEFGRYKREMSGARKV